MSLLGLKLLALRLGSGSSLFTDSKDVPPVEMLLWEDLRLLSVIPDVPVLTVELRLTTDFGRRELVIDPNTSPDRRDVELKRFLEIASRPNIAARDRPLAEADGVDGKELRPVRNLNRPNWCTIRHGKPIYQ